jgi:hypothetical protein
MRTILVVGHLEQHVLGNVFGIRVVQYRAGSIGRQLSDLSSVVSFDSESFFHGLLFL